MNATLFAKVQTDLSMVQSGDWFLPMTIKEVNQHAFITEALAKGAVGFTYEETAKDFISENDLKAPHSAVPKLREYLFSLACEWRPSITAQVAVIAGSAGKTSVKEMVGAILRSWHQDHCFVSPNNQNTKIALATQILRLPLDCQSAAFEMGARRLNDFCTPLSYLQPSVVALLNIGTAHIGEFGSKENLWKEKLSCLDSEHAKTLVVLGDNAPILDYATKTGKNILSFGFGKTNSIQIQTENFDRVILRIENQDLELLCPFQSSAKGLNVAAAVAVASAMGAPLAAIREGLANFAGVPRRFQMFKWNQITAIDDAFNASPESMAEGLQQLRKISHGKKVLLVLGSMLELGKSSVEEHKKIAHLIGDLFDISSDETSTVSVATVGSEAEIIRCELARMGMASERIRHFQSSVETQSLEKWRFAFDLIYFKGSKSIQLHKIFGA